jgi:Cytochrome P460
MAMKRICAFIVIALAVPVALLAEDKPNVQLPTDYRGWTHVKSMVILPGHPLYDSLRRDTSHYANPAALEGYKSGSFPDGSIIVFDRLEAINADNAITEGKRSIVLPSALGLPQQIAESIFDDGAEHHRVTSDRSREPPR